MLKLRMLPKYIQTSLYVLATFSDRFYQASNFCSTIINNLFTCPVCVPCYAFVPSSKSIIYVCVFTVGKFI